MRIAICTDVFLPQLSGIADSIDTLVSELRRSGHEVRLYAPALPGTEADPGIRRLPGWVIPGSGGSLVVVFPFGGLRDMRRFRPDIIHTHTFSTVGLLAVYAAWRLGAPLVGTDLELGVGNIDRGLHEGILVGLGIRNKAGGNPQPTHGAPTAAWSRRAAAERSRSLGVTAGPF